MVQSRSRPPKPPKPPKRAKQVEEVRSQKKNFDQLDRLNAPLRPGPPYDDQVIQFLLLLHVSQMFVLLLFLVSNNRHLQRLH